MLLKLLGSLGIGISIAAIPGPIFFELIRRSLSKGFKDGISLVLGEFSGNLILLTAIFFGLSSFLSSQIVRSIFFIIGGLILLWVSNSAFRLNQTDVESSYDEKIVGHNRESFITGLTIAATSPIVIAFWVSLSGSYLNELHDQVLAFVNIIFIALGFLVFFIPMAYVVHKTRHRIPPKKVVLLSKIFGAILVGYALILFRQAIR